ncbi:ribosomal protein L23/L15e core domain-containing protein [Lasiosphaeria ovina]|uniref:40S ribosomal protein S24 n=1 Tax=Lasiosphaeria ovina TaxID=92902 RepID=A0AAE0JW81_9PEZI|nr:ribosomal protein L23/L15e core domain-containing protein [Lasiosphaeria ovina]
MADSDAPVTLRTRKFIRNPLLGRKQMVVDILHPSRANISKDELRDKLATLYKANKDQVSVFGLRTQFGGGKTTGFALVYDSPEAMKKFEPHFRLVRVGLATKVERASRQQRTCARTVTELGETRSGMVVTDTLFLNTQASSARTDRRPSGERRRSRVRRRRRRNKRVAWRFFLRHLLHRVYLRGTDGQWPWLCALLLLGATSTRQYNWDEVALRPGSFMAV